MKISSVVSQKKNPNRFNVFLDGQFACGVDEDTVVNFRLMEGKEIDQETLEKVLFETEVGKLMERMYRLFGIRARSEKEVRDYLRNLSFKNKIKEKGEPSPIIIDSLINKLKQKNLINDLEFAKAWVDARGKKKGWRVIQNELIKKGVSREIIEEVVSSQTSAIRQDKIAEQLLEKRSKSFNTLPYLEKKQKMISHLMRKGFDFQLVKDLVENYLKKE